MAKLTPTAVKLIEGKNFASVATIMPDGSPQVTPVWIDHEGDTILVNSQGDRIKSKNLARDPRVALSVFDQSDPYNAVFIRGRVKEITKKGAEEHIDKMARKYLGKQKYPWRQPGQPRILIRIRPLRVSR